MMEKTIPIENKSSKINIRIISIIAFAVLFVVLLSTVGGTGFVDAALFAIAQVVFVLLPGMAVVLFIKPELEKISFYAASYLTGIGIVIAEYYLFYAIGLGEFLLAIMCAISALSVVGVIWKRKAVPKKQECEKDSWGIFACIAAVLILVLVFTIAPVNVPGADGTYANYYQDMLWNTGNIAQISHSFPITDIHISGFSFIYHYFTYVFMGVFHNVLGISAFVLNFKLLAAVQVVVLFFGTYLFATQIAKSTWLRIVLSAAMVFGSTVVMDHMLFYAYATPFAIGFMMAAAYFFVRYIKKIETAKILDADFILFIIMLVITCGSKGLFAAVVMAGAGIAMLFMLFKKKNAKVILLHGVLTLLIGGAVLIYLTFGLGTINGFSLAFATPMQETAPSYYIAAQDALAGTLGSAGVKLIVYPLYIFANHLIIAVALIWLLVNMIKFRKEGVRLEIFLFFAVLFGFVCASVIYQPGLSNMLFMTGAFPFAVCGVVRCARRTYKGADYQKITVALLASIVLAIGVGTAVQAEMGNANTAMGYRASADAGLAREDKISVAEYEGMLWLKENTEADTVFATDRHYYAHIEDIAYARFYYYTAFSERASYIEGFNYISTREQDFLEKVYNRVEIINRALENDAAAIETLIKDGVDYIVVTKFMRPGFVLDARLGQNVFENEDIAIYELEGVG